MEQSDAIVCAVPLHQITFKIGHRILCSLLYVLYDSGEVPLNFCRKIKFLHSPIILLIFLQNKLNLASYY